MHVARLLEIAATAGVDRLHVQVIPGGWQASTRVISDPGWRVCMRPTITQAVIAAIEARLATSERKDAADDLIG